MQAQNTIESNEDKRSLFSQMVFWVGFSFFFLEGLKDMLTLFFGGISEFDCTGGVCNLWF
jgi:hypothetical protein